MTTRLLGPCVLVASLIALAGCGTTTQHRGLSGALTKPSQVNMGDPAWKNSAAAQSAPVIQGTPQAVAAQPSLNQAVTNLQSQLAARGYDPGPIDGMMGERTRAAIRAYQRDRQMPVDGQVSQALVASLASH